MEELLPLIIGILWLIYTFYSRGQKKRARRQPVEAESNKRKDPSFLEQLLGAEGITFEEEEPEIQEEEIPIPQARPEKSFRRETSPFLRAELSDYIEEGQPQFQDRGKAIGSRGEIGEDESAFDDDDDTTDFDLQEAIVYSTILNAPYINYK